MKAKTKRSARRKKVAGKATQVKAAKAKARAKARPKPKPKARAKARSRSTGRRAAATSSRWVKFVEKHGIVLASAKGPVPSISEAVAGEPIVGSWWAHKKGKAIFAALCEIDDSPDVRCFKLVDGKVTFAHRKMWPALVRLGHEPFLQFLAGQAPHHVGVGAHRGLHR